MLIEQNVRIDKKINLGIQVLRMVLCFWVLCYHCLDDNNINYFLFFITKTKFYHVPCFCFISFYFSYKIFVLPNSFKVKRRIERLLIPYIIWPLLIFLIHNILFKEKILLHDLLIQLIFGRKFIGPLWYLFSMIFQTIFLYISSYIFKSYFIYFILIISFFSYCAQYSYFYDLLNNYTNNVRLPLLDTLNLLPISILGITLASNKIFETTKSKILFFIFSFIFLFFILKNDIFVDLGGYKGIIYIFTSLLLFIGFYFLPFDNLYPLTQNLIKQITNFTNGIYCLHIRFIIILGLPGTMKSCVIIYLISYLISFIGLKLLGKTKLKYLFI